MFEQEADDSEILHIKFHGFISPILVFELVGPLSTNARTSDIIKLEGNL